MISRRKSSRSEEHTSELQSRENLVCRLLLATSAAEIYPLSLHDALPIFGLRVGVDDFRHEAREFDRIFLVFEQLELERLIQAFVRLVVERPAIDRQGADVVHDLAAEVV